MRWISDALRLQEGNRTDRPGSPPPTSDNDQAPCPEPLLLEATEQLKTGDNWQSSLRVWDDDISPFVIVALDAGEKGTVQLYVRDQTGPDWPPGGFLFENILPADAPSDHTAGTYESVVVVLTANIKDAIDFQVECVDGPCEFKLIAFEHTGNCVPRAVDGEVLGVNKTIDLETLPLFPPPPAPPGGRLPRPCPGHPSGPLNGSLGEGGFNRLDNIAGLFPASGPFPARYFIVALDSLITGNSDLEVFEIDSDGSTGLITATEVVSDDTIDRYEDVVVVDASAFNRTFSAAVKCITGPCEWQLITFYHTGNCTPTLPHGVIVPGVNTQIAFDQPFLSPIYIFPPS
ncbi:unnamed protein product [Vitrella brassicaformis CCMP3155]|uniref:Uncharacterized protein n=1 Tax=Vitrella brassicaformis (strain CCMP3155) TaxID=1169540 RepID=A0A0G4FGH4_VITBC|nr:unnamed protein product [Vitrella brassicaformis CCMP3155]|eukprot:CEM11935.1 unnamed protein product [Vitrella brassicaformis CCMP3155]